MTASAFDFETLWRVADAWVEAPNRDRGGWSGVARLEAGPGRAAACYVKRQEQHRRRTLRHPLRGESTLRLEHRAIRRLQALGVGVPEPLYFAERREGGRLRAVLVTRALDSHETFDALWSRLPPARRRALGAVLAATLARLHRHRLEHRALFPKHALVRETGAGFDLRLIDLEKLRRVPTRGRATRRDLVTLARHAPFASRAARLCFLLAYLERPRADRRVRRLWHRLARRWRAKGGDRR